MSALPKRCNTPSREPLSAAWALSLLKLRSAAILSVAELSMRALSIVCRLVVTSIRSPVFIILVIYLAITYAIVALPGGIVGPLTRENGVFELLGALCFLITSILFWTAYRRSEPVLNGDGSPEKSLKRISYLLLALLFFFGAGEEISWGQRLLNLSVPETISELNAQGEFNIHNLNILTKGEEETGVLYIFNMRRLFNIFWLTFAVIIPFAVYFSLPASRWVSTHIPVGPVILAPLFLINWIVWKILWLADPYYDTVVEVIEISESNFSVLFVFFAIGAVWESIRTENQT